MRHFVVHLRNAPLFRRIFDLWVINKKGRKQDLSVYPSKKPT